MKKNKSIKNFWNRIKIFFDNNPVHAAYSVPFVTIFFFSIFIFILEIILEKLSLDQEPLTYFYVILYFVPIWILAGIFISKKKLRYLFILFIGYGMPVILSYYIYNGFTQSARENSTKTIHKRAVEYISSEIKKCNFGKSTFMNNHKIVQLQLLKLFLAPLLQLTIKILLIHQKKQLENIIAIQKMKM